MPKTIMKDQLAERSADVGAAVSTVAVSAYTFTNFLNDAALVVAILSGSLAIAWHIYKFYQEWKNRGNSESTTNIQRRTDKRSSK